ncbi:hypothetical protein HMPREF9102_1634 [Limosilactobacillus oris F0423]|uniref:Uncharacterized protein n=2 Tax=Limosilactobacillus oris TaxID=1632 RepID=E3C736_9LACO|nr:hypothetical protein HMPREF9265_0986 [Limosilactobacillus oris PB013-T2-3]EGS38612.1 hypothetical protein HMPREF9102_1634 [Limosilactobacillus oris F0423]
MLKFMEMFSVIRGNPSQTREGLSGKSRSGKGQFSESANMISFLPVVMTAFLGK